MAGVVHVPWYATVFRGDKLQGALEEIVPVALRYGATGYDLFRAQDDRYKLLQVAYFDDHIAWERYWYGAEFSAWRAQWSSYYQVPVIYGWQELVASGRFQLVDQASQAAAPPVDA